VTGAGLTRLMHDWLDTWAGIGLTVVGMTHQGFQFGLGEHGASQWCVHRAPRYAVRW
jgi:hypothetical protein